MRSGQVNLKTGTIFARYRQQVFVIGDQCTPITLELYSDHVDF